MAANVDSSLENWSTTASSNQPDGSDTADTKAEFRQIQAVVRKYFANKGSDIASASTVDLSTATGNYVHITGTTTITALGTVAAGLRYLLVFDGALTFTHNATSLIIPGSANITTAAGDRCEVVSLGSGNWRVIWYTKASGAPIGSYQPLDATLTALASSLSAAGKIPYATATDTLGELDFKDEDDMASNSATAIPSQQSVKAYADNLISGASSATPVASEDYFIFEDATDSTQKKALISSISTSPFTGKYESSATAITLGGLHTFAHSLGAVPFGVVVMLENVTADGGYSTGDRIYIDTGFQNQSGGGGQAVYADSTNVYLRVSTAVYQAHRKDTGAPFNLTTASWKLVVKAFV